MALVRRFKPLLRRQIRQIENRHHKESHAPKIQFHIQKCAQKCPHHKAKHDAETLDQCLLVGSGAAAQIIGQVYAQLGGVACHHGAGADVFDEGFAGGVAYGQGNQTQTARDGHMHAARVVKRLKTQARKHKRHQEQTFKQKQQAQGTVFVFAAVYQGFGNQHGENKQGDCREFNPNARAIFHPSRARQHQVARNMRGKKAKQGDEADGVYGTTDQG